MRYFPSRAAERLHITSSILFGSKYPMDSSSCDFYRRQHEYSIANTRSHLTALGKKTNAISNYNPRPVNYEARSKTIKFERNDTCHAVHTLSALQFNLLYTSSSSKNWYPKKFYKCTTPAQISSSLIQKTRLLGSPPPFQQLSDYPAQQISKQHVQTPAKPGDAGIITVINLVPQCQLESKLKLCPKNLLYGATTMQSRGFRPKPVGILDHARNAKQFETRKVLFIGRGEG
ncbi:hypothetical protein POM88_045672 [Heracleum sosnowskyi]|uniref:Uncharacterized protein n=1 Tax=Heracleum sosnowskyi TaxID=360622 RepID=A0AAD8H7L6_9APIA|nr:hypothetical protein POM88_045672 [Heracleum sosnowskyi]